MAQIFLALNFGEMGAFESAENSDFFHVMQNLYAQSAQNLTSDQPPPSYMEPLLKPVIRIIRLLEKTYAKASLYLI